MNMNNMKTKIVGLVLAASTLLLSGCAPFGANENPKTVVYFTSAIKYFGTMNGNMNNFFDLSSESTLQTLTDSDLIVQVIGKGEDVKYKVMSRVGGGEKLVIIMDELDAKEKKCDFEAIVAASYWDVDMGILKGKFESEEEAVVYSINKESTEAYKFTPNEYNKGGSYMGVKLNENGQLSAFSFGTYKNTVNVNSSNLPTMTETSSFSITANDPSLLPVNLKSEQWAEVAKAVSKLPPIAANGGFYGINKDGSIVEASYADGKCSVSKG